ncbi:uncharacterized protein LOC141903326 [Tubulanus polymorphus]|uniref:uncharacterized protein LOC141903326 n=1 Tax=Tubulanus polymorphus TaxID=672921 RepID=UPI003DA5DCCD
MEDSLDTCSVSEGNYANNSTSSDNDDVLCVRINQKTGSQNSGKNHHNPRKNKRKMSQPRRLSDYSTKRFCPDSPGSMEGSLEPPEICPRRSDGSDDGATPSLDDDEEELTLRTRESRVSSSSDPDLDAIRLPPGVIPVPQGFEYGAMSGAFFSHNQSGDEMNRAGNQSPNSFYQGDDEDQSGRKPRKNYKSMTMERRIEANARERSRVHTISAAFENLRRAVPSYSYNQKLSKLAILRIACCYILSLSRLAEMDYSRDQSRPSFGECVDLCTRTIQTEGRAKKRH